MTVLSGLLTNVVSISVYNSIFTIPYIIYKANNSIFTIPYRIYNASLLAPEKVQVGKDQEKAQSEKDSHSKNRGGKKPN